MTKKRILIVDDEESVLFVLKNSLRKLGKQYEIITATDGLQALEELRRQPVDLLVTDYRMAEMDGLQLMEKVQSVQPDTRSILITAYGNDTLEADARRLDAYQYLTKPLDINIFRRIVKEALERDVAVSRGGLMVLSNDRYRQAVQLLKQLQTDVGCRFIILTDGNGQRLAQSGSVEGIRVAEIAALLSSSMATLQDAGKALDRDENAMQLSYREGKRDNLYAINIGDQLLLILVIENSAYGSRLGTVWYYAHQTAVALRKAIGEAEFATAPQIFEARRNEAAAAGQKSAPLTTGRPASAGNGQTAGVPQPQPAAQAAPSPPAPSARKPEPAASAAPPPPPETTPPQQQGEPPELLSFADAVALGLIPETILEQE